MTEERLSGASSSESDPSTAKRRKKRMWDQPDESLFSAGVAHPGFSPLTSMGSLAGAALSSASVSASSLAIPFSTSVVTPVQLVQIPLQQHAIVQKLLQPKMQDELIAREIVINDADSAIRYKLTKRQTQEELQKSTGAVVITRGKYRPPNAPADGERPLYLHISGASHLETTAQRIKAVDQAAAMVEEMLKQETASNGVKSDHVLSTCVFLGFEADPSLDIVSRIRGPNDQYVNHIMKETGATISVRGLGSGYSENGQTEEQPLHLLLSSNDAKKLEHAKLFAENLLDTISADCGQSRVSSCKVYGAVPPPPQLQAGVSRLGNASKVHDSDALCSTSSAGVSSIPSQGLLSQSIRLPNPGLPVVNTPCVPFSLASGTSYMGYGGIYPQATPLQQVALVLKQSTSPVTATVAPLVTSASNDHPDNLTVHVVEKRSKRRKFQELPASAARPANPNQNVQGSDFHMPPDPASPSLQDPGQLIKPSSNGVLLPPPRRLLPPPPPPKFNSAPKSRGDNGIQMLKTESLPDTLIKLTEYGDDDGDDDSDDDSEETARDTINDHSSGAAVAKPFWAI